MNPLYDLFHEFVTMQQNIGREKLFLQIKALLTKGVTVTLPKRNHSFFTTVDFSVIVQALYCSKLLTKEN